MLGYHVTAAPQKKKIAFIIFTWWLEKTFSVIRYQQHGKFVRQANFVFEHQADTTHEAASSLPTNFVTALKKVCVVPGFTPAFFLFYFYVADKKNDSPVLPVSHDLFWIIWIYILWFLKPLVVFCFEVIKYDNIG